MSTTDASDARTEQLRSMMREVWGYEEFRPLQERAMLAGISGQDSLVVLPTGGGKSLCYQVPALCMDGMAVVISPLISLMKDQVDALRANGVAADDASSSVERWHAVCDACPVRLARQACTSTCAPTRLPSPPLPSATEHLRRTRGPNSAS